MPKLSRNHTKVARSGETLRQGEWRDELLRCGIRGKGGQQVRFARLEPLPGYRWLNADGETMAEKAQRVAVKIVDDRSIESLKVMSLDTI